MCESCLEEVPASFQAARPSEQQAESKGKAGLLSASPSALSRVRLAAGHVRIQGSQPSEGLGGHLLEGQDRPHGALGDSQMVFSVCGKETGRHHKAS